jgi:glycine/D-amino acid oxidase-like deaminating enzyme
MAAPLAPDYADGVLWHDTAGAPLVDEPDPLPAEVDVVVVGGGYCGLSAAAELARRGRSVAVLDRGPLGIGASTRSGGMVLPELHVGPDALVERFGDDGRRMHEAVEEAFDHVEALTSGPDGIDCDYARTGRLELAHGRASAERLRALGDELARRGHEARYVDGDDLASEVGTDRYVAGLVVARSGGLQPARFHAGMVTRARAAGVGLHPSTPVAAVRADGRAVELADGRTVACGDVLVALNAHVDDGVSPGLRRRVLPMGSYIVATGPLEPALQKEVLPTGRMVYDTKNLLSYWRLDPDGRMVFGGRKGLSDTTVAAAREDLHARLAAIHPQIADVPLVRAWGGSVALTRDRLPHCGRIDGAWYATGCNGSGVALNTWLGHAMAGAICGGQLPPFSVAPLPSIPFQGLRGAWLPVLSVALRAQDRIGETRGGPPAREGGGAP